MSTQAHLPPEWIPKRQEIGGLRQIRRGEDGKPCFKGQDKDEEVKMVVRQHPIFLIKPALPPVASLVMLAVVLTLFIRFPEYGPIWAVLSLLTGLLFLFAAGFFLWKRFLNWWVDIDIITNKRVIICRGFFLPSRKVTTLDKVMQVSIVKKSLLHQLFQLGDVHLYLAGSDYTMANVPRPQAVRDAVYDVHQSFKQKAATKTPEKPPEIRDPEMKALLEKLGKKEKIPELPNADEPYSQWRDPEMLRKPLRRFGGPGIFSRSTKITYKTSDEQTVMYIQRSNWLLALRLAPFVLGLLAAIVTTFVFASFAILSVIVALMLLVTVALIVSNFVDDVFILTNKRVIDIERKFFFFKEERIEAEFKNIKDTKIQITNVFQVMLDVGNLIIETPGNNPDIKMTMIDHPFFIADKINMLKGFKEKTDKAKEHNRRQEELSTWFTHVVAAMEGKVVSRGVPDLQTQDLWTAAAIAAEFGMKVVPVGEDASYPHIEAGHIVSQEPLPGTLMDINPDSPSGRPQIHVILSKRS